MSTRVRAYLRQDAWNFAFQGSSDPIVVDYEGNVYKGSISFANLVNSSAGAIGPAGYNSEGDITIFANQDDATYAGAVHVMTMSGGKVYNLNAGTAGGNYLFFAFQIDNSNQEQRLYLGGQLAVTIPMTGSIDPFKAIRTAFLGGYVDVENATDQYQGIIDDFRVYREILTPVEIEDVFKWGNQDLQFQKLTFVPRKEVSQGYNASLKLSSEEYMQIRNIGIEYQEKNLR